MLQYEHHNITFHQIYIPKDLTEFFNIQHSSRIYNGMFNNSSLDDI